MGQPSAASIREHVRHVYRQAAVFGVSASAYLDQLAEDALKAQRSGKTIQSAGSGGTSTSYFVFQSFTPNDVLELIDILRPLCANAQLVDALAACPVSRRVTLASFASADL